jgi:ferredoxin
MSPTNERRSANLQVVVDRNLCYYCGACVAVCPPDSIFLDNSYLAIDKETCTLCERCTAMCPVHALSIVEQPKWETHTTH